MLCPTHSATVEGYNETNILFLRYKREAEQKNGIPGDNENIKIVMDDSYV